MEMTGISGVQQTGERVSRPIGVVAAVKTQITTAILLQKVLLLLFMFEFTIVLPTTRGGTVRNADDRCGPITIATAPRICWSSASYETRDYFNFLKCKVK